MAEENQKRNHTVKDLKKRNKKVELIYYGRKIH